jgi:sulfite reductase alpha subunit-like flavoprotein
LNPFKPENLPANDTILLMIATTGQGEVPMNGQQFLKKLSLSTVELPSLKYSIFGIGDSGYHSSFNGAARKINVLLQQSNAIPLGLNGVFEADITMENPPFATFQSWWGNLETRLTGHEEISTESTLMTEDLYLRQGSMIAGYKEATLAFNPAKHEVGRMLELSLEIPDPAYEDMGHIRVLPRNSQEVVSRLMELLGVVDTATTLTLSPSHGEPQIQSIIKIADFLRDFVDILRTIFANWIGSRISFRS